MNELELFEHYAGLAMQAIITAHPRWPTERVAAIAFAGIIGQSPMLALDLIKPTGELK